MSESKALKLIERKFSDVLISSHSQHGDHTAVIEPEGLLNVVQMLRDNHELEFNYLMDLTAVDYYDYPGKDEDPRFEVVYHFYSTKHNQRLRLKVPVDEPDPEVDSLMPFYKIADWFERECWDMFGIKFRGHKDLRRLLMYPSFKGHPLRKDYPRTKHQPITDEEFNILDPMTDNILTRRSEKKSE
jgi:NADH-quinone oxidoreductase subunit C